MPAFSLTNSVKQEISFPNMSTLKNPHTSPTVYFTKIDVYNHGKF